MFSVIWQLYIKYISIFYKTEISHFCEVCMFWSQNLLIVVFGTKRKICCHCCILSKWQNSIINNLTFNVLQVKICIDYMYRYVIDFSTFLSLLLVFLFVLHSYKAMPKNKLSLLIVFLHCCSFSGSYTGQARSNCSPLQRFLWVRLWQLHSKDSASWKRQCHFCYAQHGRWSTYDHL